MRPCNSQSKTKRLSLAAGRLAALLFFCALGGCAGLVQRVTVERRPLSFFGHVSFAAPQIHDGRVIVPVSFRDGELSRSSALETCRIDARVSGSQIEITGLSSIAGPKPPRRELRLRHVPAGCYTIVYRDPDGTRHPVGQITIPPAF